MTNILINKENISDYIINSLLENTVPDNELVYDKYHHNTSYDNLLSILKNGILPIKTIKELNLKNISDEQLKLLDDISSHINGIDGISLSVMGLTDIYPSEEEYIPYNPNYIDFIVSSNLKTFRCTEYYGNEYITYGDIEVSKIKSIDIRLIKLIENTKNKDEKFYEDIIHKYNILLRATKYIMNNNLQIKMREMSSNQKLLVLENIIDLPTIILR